MRDLQPSLWRTCRILANASRIRCLKCVLVQPVSQVGAIAQELGIPLHYASQYLRALQARGLLEATRQSRWVYYAPTPDPLVPSAKPLLDALRTALLEECRSERQIVHDLTAFTHPRRLAILACLLRRKSATAETLAAFTRISQPAMSRHLTKLQDRDLVVENKGRWALKPCTHQPAQTLLACLRAHAHTPGWNENHPRS